MKYYYCKVGILYYYFEAARTTVGVPNEILGGGLDFNILNGIFEIKLKNGLK